MRVLVRRYVTAEQRARDEVGVTEDDVMEIRQDISTLRFELIDILHNNGMKTPRINMQDTTSEIAFLDHNMPSLPNVKDVNKKANLFYFFFNNGVYLSYSTNQMTDICLKVLKRPFLKDITRSGKNMLISRYYRWQ